ncbi:hypothetical protein M0805_008382 [Coniferiporia weirii]|nr:hypothetical protein M0805_008382 [Coniferiporia weirii]
MTASDDDKQGAASKEWSLIYESTVKSLVEAGEAADRIGLKVKDSEGKDSNQVGSKIIGALLEPATLVADILNSLGQVYPPCAIAGSALKAVVQIEAGRRDNNEKIAFIMLDVMRTLATLGRLKLGFKVIPTQISQFNELVGSICETIERFGQFSQSFYSGKKMILRHLIYSKRNKTELDKFRNELNKHRKNVEALTQAQILTIVAHNTGSLQQNSDTLSHLDEKLDKIYGLVIAMSEEEKKAVSFVEEHGGEDVVLGDEGTLHKFAILLNKQFNEGVYQAVKENVEEALRQNRNHYMLLFDFTRKQIEESERSIKRDLKEGPYELIEDEDMKVNKLSPCPELWISCLHDVYLEYLERNREYYCCFVEGAKLMSQKAAKESVIKRRKFIDALAYYFTTQFRRYRIANGMDREDAWTKAIISKVHSIGDVIDDDSSGYISVEELNDFMRKKPEGWSVPQWIAYWAYGCDTDNIHYKEKIHEAYGKLEELCTTQHHNASLIKSYMEKTKDSVLLLLKSVYVMHDLDVFAERKMSGLRANRRSQNERKIKAGLESANYEIDHLSMSAICGSDRVEMTFIPLVALLLSYHAGVMSEPEATSNWKGMDNALTSMENLLGVVRGRVSDLRQSWRRQRIDVNIQMRYYANGLFEDYYLEEFASPPVVIQSTSTSSQRTREKSHTNKHVFLDVLIKPQEIPEEQELDEDEDEDREQEQSLINGFRSRTGGLKK